ncbi:MAG: DNA replication protein DnaD, partial [Acetatifactor sp.]|nr:DNA replication protein DnaD [Acetatifactor sp.]
RMLSMWKEQNVQSTADIIRLDEAYHRNKKNNGRVSDADGASHKPINRFNQFTQNTYDFEALEKKLLSN